MTKRITVEAAFTIASQTAIETVQRFRVEVGGYPDLRRIAHLEALAEILDLPEAERRRPEVSGYDIAYAFLHHLVETAPYSPLRSFNDDRVHLLTSGVFGRLCYNPPPREFLFRSEQLRYLLVNADPREVAARVTELAGFVSDANRSIAAAVASSESVRTRLVDRFCNPYIWIESRIEKHCLANDQGVAGLQAYYEAVAERSSEDAAYYL
jgi:hypothetical protein